MQDLQDRISVRRVVSDRYEEKRSGSIYTNFCIICAGFLLITSENFPETGKSVCKQNKK